MSKWDAIVVGARCGGSPTAMLLAARGYRVLLVDRSRFPSDVLSSHYIHQNGLRKLTKWGIAEKVIACGCPAIGRMIADLGNHNRLVIDYITGKVEFNGSVVTDSAANPRGPAYAPRRRFLDSVLLNAAIENGVEFREGFTVSDIIFEDSRVVGIVGAGDSGIEERIHGNIVVGADGRYSTIAKILKPATRRDAPSRSVAIHAYWSGLEPNGMETFFREGFCVHVTPTNDGLACVGLGVARDRCEADFMRHIEENFYGRVNEIQELKARLAEGKREEPFVGTDYLPNYVRQCHGFGWALVGDAGCNRDPVLGQGISEAFRQADLLADAICAWQEGQCSMLQALGDYEAARDRVTIPLFEAASKFSELRLPSEETFSMMYMFDSEFASQLEQEVTPSSLR